MIAREKGSEGITGNPFLTFIDNPEDINKARLEKLLRKEAADQIQETRQILAEMNSVNYSKRCANEKKAKTAANKENKENFLGVTIPNPLKAIPAYLEATEVQELDMMICKAAEENRVVSGKELSGFTNHLLVRISIKNGLRKQVRTI